MTPASTETGSTSRQRTMTGGLCSRITLSTNTWTATLSLSDVSADIDQKYTVAVILLGLFNEIKLQSFYFSVNTLVLAIIRIYKSSKIFD